MFTTSQQVVHLMQIAREMNGRTSGSEGLRSTRDRFDRSDDNRDLAELWIYP